MLLAAVSTADYPLVAAVFEDGIFLVRAEVLVVEVS